jgi:hypothetical protein
LSAILKKFYSKINAKFNIWKRNLKMF